MIYDRSNLSRPYLDFSVLQHRYDDIGINISSCCEAFNAKEVLVGRECVVYHICSFNEFIE